MYKDRTPIDSLLSFSISDLRRILQKGGYKLSDMETILSRPGSSAYAVYTWTRTYRNSGKVVDTNSIKIELHREDSLGILYIEFVYSVQRGGETSPEKRVRYNLRRKESNLKPGYYRYYFADPYSRTGEGLCSKLYLYEGNMVSRCKLRDYGLLYKQQREGHKQRYLWTFRERIPERKDLKYRKTHYRGRETPFWRRYLHLQTEGEIRLMEALISLGYVDYKDLLPETDSDN